MSTLAIECDHVTHRYGDFTAVDDLSLTVDVGETMGLLGPNGAGKTTCFYMIVGLVPADAGRIVLDGRALLTVEDRGATTLQAQSLAARR